MDGDDVRGPDQPEPGGKTEQQIFDEQIARASGKFVVMVGGVGILAALVLSTIALVISASDHTKTVTVQAAAPATQAAPAKAHPSSRATRWARSCSSRGSPTSAPSAAGRATR